MSDTKGWGDTHAEALLMGARDAGAEPTPEILREGLRRLLAALERHEDVGPGYARRVGRSVAVDFRRRANAAEARREREEAARLEGRKRERAVAWMLGAVRRRADGMRDRLTPTQVRDVEAALERLEELHAGGPYRVNAEEDPRARQVRHQARRRGLILLAEGLTSGGRRVAAPAPPRVREWLLARPGAHRRS